MAKVVMLLPMMMMMMMMAGFCIAARYHVGDDFQNAWRSMDQGHYQDWAANKNFHVGDTLVFSYNPQIYEHEYISYSDDQYHNVKQVTQDDFESCNAISPIATYNDGFDEITLDRPGDYYFICGYVEHCLGGQKIHILVTPIPTPISSPIPSPNAASYHQPSLMCLWVSLFLLEFYLLLLV